MFKIDNSYLDLISKRKELEIKRIKNCNDYTSKYGLTLTEEQINSVMEKIIVALNDTGRIELRESITDKLIKEFCDSPYISQSNYLETLYELIDIFYQYKNETMDLISDDELIKFMKESFDNICQGDLDYLSGTVLYHMRDNLLNGKPIDFNEEEEEN